MKFFIQNNELDKSVQEIRRKIRTLMNGVVADSMKDKGIVYKKNFGVDLPHLRDLARKYPPGHDLAQRLWALQIRETMILATLLEPADTFAESMAGEWMQSVNNIELVEQICMNLFSKLSYGSQLAIRLIHVDQKWSRITGFTLSARLWKDLDNRSGNWCIWPSKTPIPKIFTSTGLFHCHFADFAGAIKRLLSIFRIRQKHL